MKGFKITSLAALVAAAAALGAAAVAAGQPARFSLEEDQVLLTVQAKLGPKELSGVSRAVAGTVVEVPGGGLRVSARVPMASFESGNPALDAVFHAALQADRFPDAEFEGAAQVGKRSGQFTVPLEGTLSVHGVAQRLSVPVKVLRDGKLLYVEAAFPVDLGAYGIDAPRIGPRPIAPQVQIELRARLRPSGATAALVADQRAPRG